MTAKNETYEGAQDLKSRAPMEQGEPSVPSPTLGPETVRCSRCDHKAEPAGKGRCSACGCWLSGNVGALVHGGRRMRLSGGTALDAAERVAIRDAIIEDIGGESQISTVLREVVRDFAFGVVLRDRLADHLAAVGPLTRRGAKRAAVDLYMTASQRVERLAKLIGTERRAARVPDLREYIEQAASGGGR